MTPDDADRDEALAAGRPEAKPELVLVRYEVPWRWRLTVIALLVVDGFLHWVR